MSKVLVLRTCNPDMTSYGGFKWPTEGPVETPDWRDDNRCGGGLHGALWGEDEGLSNVGNHGIAVVGDNGAATAGHHGQAEAGLKGSATAGGQGKAISGAGGTATVGILGCAAAGEWGEIRIHWYDGSRYRLAVGYIGENGLEPNTLYQYFNGRGFVKTNHGRSPSESFMSPN